MFSSYKLTALLIILGLFLVGCSHSENLQVETKAEYVDKNIFRQKYVNKDIFVGECIITHYCICEKCCGKTPDHPAYGITKSGRKAMPWVSVAVDESLIPLGSEVIIDYGDGNIKQYRADDTGSAIKGNRIDICVDDHQTALNLGIKTAKVYYKSNLK